MQELEKDDPLWIYLDEISRIPAAGDPVLLAQLAAQGDETAQANLVNVCLHRVISLAEEYVGKGVLLLDLYQEGSLGLWQAILSYDGAGDFEELCVNRICHTNVWYGSNERFYVTTCRDA